MSWLSNTVGSIAGSVFGSAVQNHYNSANAAQANAWNVENYKHRYQWAVEDMRKAGLNPILAATNGVGGSISGASAASVGMSDIGSTMNSAKAASAAERQAKNAEHLAVSQIEKNVAEADSVRQSTHGTVLQNGILANDLNLREQTYEKRLGYELEKMNLELENLRLQGSYLSSGVLNNVASANRANSAAAFDNIQTEMAGMERDFYKNLESLTGRSQICRWWCWFGCQKCYRLPRRSLFWKEINIMSNKTTMILTFIVSVVVPFIQEVVDLIEALKGKASSNTVTAKKVVSDFQADVAQLVEPVADKNDSKKTSRFFGSWRDAK